MKKLISVLSIFFALSSCATLEKGNKSDEKFFPDDRYFSEFNDDRLVFEIDARFAECGEWGGHKERMLVTTRKDNEFYLKYDIWCADCDSLVLQTNGTSDYEIPVLSLVDSCTIKLNSGHKKDISEFTQKMVKAKFREVHSGNSGNIFEIYKYGIVDSITMKVHVYGYDRKLVSDYLELLDKLDLSQKTEHDCIQYDNTID